VALAKAWPAADPPVYIQQVVRQGIEGSLMPAWAEAEGGPLTDEQIGDVAAFVLTLAPIAAATPIPETAGPMSGTATLLLLAALAAVVVVVLVLYYRRPRTG
jgi:mono/diheme cytochrome c family protein